MRLGPFRNKLPPAATTSENPLLQFLRFFFFFQCVDAVDRVSELPGLSICLSNTDWMDGE